ncbi:hypothetical protein HW555_004620 [Spodoptera exigua]|uniref:Ig-like domain-containing protein n=1 Tax=Spodoptera exigua TaxID=7107 RepID=A0A835GMT0_SPOEX|nr:hypothetical protein HW555_004620 [Spodoptera exigua]
MRRKQGKVPRFEDSLNNLTVSLGREAVFTCVVNDLGSYRVAWLRVDTQTILDDSNPRDHKEPPDRRQPQRPAGVVPTHTRRPAVGQRLLNTDPMKSQTAYLDVVDSSVNGAVLQLVKVSRLHMGAYLCIASNGVPPSVSKRVMLVVHFPPIMTIQNQLVGAKEGDTVHLDCHSEAFPKSINYWTINDQIISQSDKRFEITAIERGYEVDMRLKIKKVALSGKFEEMQYNEVGDSDESPDVSELEALKRSAGVSSHPALGLFVVIYLVL